MSKSLLEAIDLARISSKPQSYIRSEHERALDASFGKRMLPDGKSKSSLYTVGENELPAQVEQSYWTILEDPERLFRDFIFENFKSLFYFVSEVLKEQERIRHHAEIVIDNRNVSITTYTHDFNGVTKLDKDFTRFCDEIYSDIFYFNWDDENVWYANDEWGFDWKGWYFPVFWHWL